MNSKERFSNRVDTYVLYRPSYPQEVMDYLYGVIGLKQESVVADVGAGTGIFSKLLLERGSQVIAVEPNKEMREAALKDLEGAPNYRAVPGSAEETGLMDHSVDFIVCAQAFHWFDRTAARKEFERILKPGGKIVLIWNNRLTEGTPFREEYDRFLHTFGTDYKTVTQKNITPDALGAFFEAGDMQIGTFPNHQRFDLEGLAGRVLSSSYIPVPGDPSYEAMMDALRALFERNAENGKVSFDYETEVFWGS
ncbi:class I SAM-dependent methyltransferase [Paenibacillus guangzhouensis]|uniref:class I SAM-dependent methyltransferase n=1 Tax=Paenibacillus guangzhouensis TaxID=1473112 RepID=UPI0012671903|nr:class I SAM-dependent methyltransferase [Paenibacillus guangzhouensis]